MAPVDRERVSEWLSAYLDGELDADTSRRVERLLREDGEVRRLLEELRRTVQTVSSLPRHTAPASMAEEIQTRLERAELLGDVGAADREAGRGRSPLKAILSMAAVLVLLVAGLWYLAGGKPPGASSPGDRVAVARKRHLDGDRRKGPVTTSRQKRTHAAVANGLFTTADFDRKLRAGASFTAIRDHQFENEPVRLVISTGSEDERDVVVTRVRAYLTDHGAVDLAGTLTAPETDEVQAGRFFYQGAPNRNFAETSQRQILVRASRRELDGLFEAIGRAMGRRGGVTLAAGPAVIQGLASARAALKGLGRSTAAVAGIEPTAPEVGPVSDGIGRGEESEPASSRGPGSPPGGLFDGLLKTVGLDPEVLSPEIETGSASQEAGATGSRVPRVAGRREPGKAYSAGRGVASTAAPPGRAGDAAGSASRVPNVAAVNARSRRLAGKDRRAPGISGLKTRRVGETHEEKGGDEKTAEQSAEPIPEPQPLVARRLGVLMKSAKRGRKMEQGFAGRGKKKTTKYKRKVATAPTTDGAVEPPSGESYVTLVVQVIVGKPHDQHR